MDARTALIAFAFAVLAAGVVWLGFEGQKRYDAAQAERAAVAAVTPPQADGKSPTLVWLQGDLGSTDRIALALLCVGLANAAWLWMVFQAFSEHVAWGFVVLLGNLLGAIAFAVLGSRKSMAPLFVMTSAYGLLFFLR